MYKESFKSNINFNKLLSLEDSFQKDIKETYPVCYLIHKYINGDLITHKNFDDNDDFNYVSIGVRDIEKILGGKIYRNRKREHLFFKVFEVDDRYKFNDNNYKGNTYTKAYRLKDSFISKFLDLNLVTSNTIIFNYGHFKIKKHYMIKGLSFKNRKEILDSKIITRKDFDLNKEKYLEYYNAIIATKLKE